MINSLESVYAGQTGFTWLGVAHAGSIQPVIPDGLAVVYPA